jgi:hypothetical protein
MAQTKPKAFVFVLMPFSETFSDIYDLGIMPACKEAGAYCERVDKQIFFESILDRVYNQIAKADLIVADMTGRNPNVFYETGYAHALNKQVILLTQNTDDIPFDLKHYSHIVYGGKIGHLKNELEKRVKWCVENPKESLNTVDLNVALYVRGRHLEDKMALEFSSNYQHFSIDIHNQTNKPLYEASYGIALITPTRVKFNSIVNSVIPLPDGQYLYNLAVPKILLPDSWGPVEVTFEIPENQRRTGMDTQLRLFSELGPKTYVLTFQGGPK